MSTLGPEDYFMAGLELLAEGGVDLVTITNLCDRLGVTKGSFYHHFQGGPDFQDRLLEYWAEERARRLVAVVDTTPDPLERIELQKEFGIDLNHAAESAIRAWARSDARAAAVQGRVDAARERALAAAFAGADMPPEQARSIARIGIAILIGSQQRNPHVERSELTEMFDAYQAWVESELPAPETRRRLRRARF